MKLVKIVIVLLTVFSTVILQAQEIAFNYNESAELELNGLNFQEDISIQKLIEILGEASNKVTKPSGEISYFYEEKGIVFYVMEDIVKGIGINYIWDGDENFPETSFTGKLTIGELEVSKETNSDDFKTIKKVEFTCPGSMMCASSDRSAKNKCLTSFIDSKISQLMFILE